MALSKKEIKRVNHKAAFLKFLKSLSSSKRKEVLPYLSNNSCNCIFECVYNLLKNNSIKNRSKLKKRLENYKKDLRFLGTSNKNFYQKRKRLDKVGETILPIVIEGVLPSLLNLERQ